MKPRTGPPISRVSIGIREQKFGSEAYAIEELVAELGAAFLCADLDLALEPVRITPPILLPG